MKMRNRKMPVLGFLSLLEGTVIGKLATHGIDGSVAVGFALGSECPIRALPDMPDATGQRACDYYCSEVGVFEKGEYLDLYHHVLAIIIIQSKPIFSPVHSCACHIAFQLTSRVPSLSGTANPPFTPSRVLGFSGTRR